jgi:hypothetical protein
MKFLRFLLLSLFLGVLGAPVFAIDGGDLLESVSGGSTAVVSVKRQTFTASGTYTPCAGLLFSDLVCIGGGGGGGGGPAQSGTGPGVGGGGGAGSEGHKLVVAATIGVSQTVTIGNGGTAGTTGGANGGTGGTTSIGSIITCPGGLGGVTDNGSGDRIMLGGSGQAATSGDYNGTGAQGGTGFIPGNGAGFSGAGGSTSLGGGGAALTNNNDFTGNSGVANTGGGGGGAADLSSPRAGGAGGKGIVFITEYCSK